MDDSEKIYAVLTGDLVKSSRLTSDVSAGAMGRLKETAIEFAQQFPDSIGGRMDTFRHDSWQLLVEQPAIAIRLALFLRAALKMGSDAHTKFDTRISIGIGTVELISKRRISDSRGPAFTNSGQGLDAMDGQHLALVSGNDKPILWNGLRHSVVPLLDCIVGDWTPTESRAVFGALKGWTQAETAANWPLREPDHKQPSRQAVGDSLVRAHWNTVATVLKWIELELEPAQGVA